MLPPPFLQPKYGVDVNEQNVYGWTALMQAACYGHLPSVVLLLQNGANVNVRNSWGATALVGAAQGGFITVAQVSYTASGFSKISNYETSRVLRAFSNTLVRTAGKHACNYA